MRHEHLVVTVESGLKERIDDDLDAGESLEAWVADAIERKLDRADDESAADSDGADSANSVPTDSRSESEVIDLRGADADASASGGPDRSDRDRPGVGGKTERDDSDDSDDEYDEGFEYVDDCGI